MHVCNVWLGIVRYGSVCTITFDSVCVCGKNRQIYDLKPLFILGPRCYRTATVTPVKLSTGPSSHSMRGALGYGPSEISVVCTGTYVHCGDVITIGQALPTLRGQETGGVWSS